jgi:hypothetical protein
VKSQNWNSSISGRKERIGAGASKADCLIKSCGFSIEILSSSDIADVILGNQDLEML